MAYRYIFVKKTKDRDFCTYIADILNLQASKTHIFIIDDLKNIVLRPGGKKPERLRKVLFFSSLVKLYLVYYSLILDTTFSKGH